MAKLNYRYGGMNVGKSMDALRAAHGYEESGNTVWLGKVALDTKGGNKITSRIGLEREVDLLIKPDTNLLIVVGGLAVRPDVCIVDEAQFLSSTHVDQLDEVARDLDIAVICYGLRTDFQNKGFEGSTRLLELADDIQEIRGTCGNTGCTRQPRRAGRKEDGQWVTEGDSIVIDDDDRIEYVQLCKYCHHELTGM